MSTKHEAPPRPTTVQSLHLATDALTTPARKTVEYADFDQTAVYFTPPRLEQLEDIVAKGPGKIGTGGGGSSDKRAQAPFYLPAYGLVDEIRMTARTNTQRLSNGPVPIRQTLAEVVKAWTAAATTAGGAEAMEALKQQRRWIETIDTMTVPVEMQEIEAACTECTAAHVMTLDEDGNTVKRSALVFQINDGDSFIRCRKCGSIWEHEQVVEVAAWHHGVTADEHLSNLREAAAAKGQRVARDVQRRDQDEAFEHLRAYAAKHGHLPPTGSNATPHEWRLAIWMRRHSRTPGATPKARARFEAIQALQDKFPSRSQANRLAKLTTTETTTEGMAA